MFPRYETIAAEIEEINDRFGNAIWKCNPSIIFNFMAEKTWNIVCNIFVSSALGVPG